MLIFFEIEPQNMLIHMLILVLGLIQTLRNALRGGGGQSICYKTLQGFLRGGGGH